MWRNRPVKFGSLRPCVYTGRRSPSIALLNPSWTARFAQALALGNGAGFGSSPARGFCERDSARREDLTVTFIAGHAEIVAWLYLDAGYAQFQWGEQRSPLLPLAGRAEALRSLAVEALPADTALRSIAVCSVGAADSLSAPSFAPGVAIESPPGVLQQIPPDYPNSAADEGVDGTVEILARVGKDGAVLSTAILTSVPMLDAAAVRSVEQWSFEPARWNGRAVSVWVVLPVTFNPH